MASYRAISKKLAELFLPVDSSNEERRIAVESDGFIGLVKILLVLLGAVLVTFALDRLG